MNRTRLPTKNNAWLGIDPGKTGCACVLLETHEGLSPIFFDWPSSNNLQKVIYTLKKWHIKYNIQLAVMEKVHSMPGQGVKSVFTFGTNNGHWQMLLSMLKIPTQHLTPQAWRKGLVTKSDGPDPKSQVETVCVRLFPQFMDQLFGPRGGYKDGRGDSLLIAEAARRLNK